MTITPTDIHVLQDEIIVDIAKVKKKLISWTWRHYCQTVTVLIFVLFSLVLWLLLVVLPFQILRSALLFLALIDFLGTQETILLF